MSAQESAPDLNGFSTDQLVDALLDRGEEALIRPDGLLNPNVYRLAGLLGIRTSIDGAPIRLNDNGDPELMAIVRGTGPYAGKLCLVGGGIGRVKQNGKFVPQSFEEALNQHFDQDLGLQVQPISGSWHRPDYVEQDMAAIDGQLRPGFAENPAQRHLAAFRYMVKVVGGRLSMGSTELGGQEAEDVVWFSRRNMPGADAFGYNHDRTYDAFLDRAQTLPLEMLLSNEK